MIPYGMSISQYLDDPTIDDRERNRRRVNASLGRYSPPYDPNHKPAKPKRRKSDNRPPVRYVRDRLGTPSIHSGPNREMRRRSDYLMRTGFYDQTTGDWITGWRTKLRHKTHKAERKRAEMMGVSPRPIRVSAK